MVDKISITETARFIRAHWGFVWPPEKASDEIFSLFLKITLFFEMFLNYGFLSPASDLVSWRNWCSLMNFSFSLYLKDHSPPLLYFPCGNDLVWQSPYEHFLVRDVLSQREFCSRMLNLLLEVPEESPKDLVESLNWRLLSLSLNVRSNLELLNEKFSLKTSNTVFVELLMGFYLVVDSSHKTHKTEELEQLNTLHREENKKKR